MHVGSQARVLFAGGGLICAPVQIAWRAARPAGGGATCAVRPFRPSPLGRELCAPQWQGAITSVTRLPQRKKFCAALIGRIVTKR